MFNLKFEAYKNRKLQIFNCSNTIEMKLIKYNISGYALVNAFNNKIVLEIIPFDIYADSISSEEEFNNKIVEMITIDSYENKDILGAYIIIQAVYEHDIMCGQACFSIDAKYINSKNYILSPEEKDYMFEVYNEI